MKNTIKRIGIITLLATIGFAFAACGNGTTGGAEGTFTLTNIPAEFNGKYAIVLARSPQLPPDGIWGIQGIAENGDMILTQISNGKAAIPY